MKVIRIALDEKCVSEEKIEKDMLGGAERMCMLWERYLVEAGYTVSRWPMPPDNPLDPDGVFDLCIHSNDVDPRVKAKKNILWGGTWHVCNDHGKADRTIILTDFMRERYGWAKSECDVIPAPFDHDLLKFKTDTFVPHRIVCNSNASRYFQHLLAIANILTERKVDFEWYFCGGSQLYSPMYREEHDFMNRHPNVHYQGILPRAQMLAMEASGHVHCYPAFSDIWETQGVAFLEAAALGVPVVLANISPLKEVLPEAWLCNNYEETADTIVRLFERTDRWRIDISRYDSDVVFEQLLDIVKELIGEPDEVCASCHY